MDTDKQYRDWITEQIAANELQMRVLTGAFRVKKVIAGRDWKTDEALRGIESDMVKSRLAIDELKVMLVEHDTEHPLDATVPGIGSDSDD